MPTLSEVLTTGQGIERSFNCPVHDDGHASASVNTIKGVWVCYACGASGVVDGAPPPDVDSLARALFTPANAMTHSEEWLDLFDAHHPSRYWSQRFDYATASAFRCGEHPLTGEATYPMRSAAPGNPPVGVVVRTKDGQPKYLYPTGSPTSRTMFNIESLARRGRRWRAVILCEGATDVMAVYHAWPTISDDADAVALGCYGSSVHRPQAQIVSQMVAPSLVVTAFDNDAAGRLATRSAQEVFRPIPVVSAPIPSLKGAVKDLADLEPDHRTSVLKRALNTT